MRDKTLLRLMLVALAAGVLGLAGWLLAGGFLVASTFTEAELAQAVALLGPRAPLAAMLVLLGGAAVVPLARAAWLRWVAPAGRLQEQARVLLETDAATQLPGQGPPALCALVATINGLVAQREALKAQIDQRVAEAARGIEQERGRLAALMAELSQAVVVCNLEGRVLLYNQRARQQFRPEQVGLGRSIHGVLDAALLEHVLARLRQRLVAGEAHPVARLASVTREGRVLQVQLAGVLERGALSGFVLLLDDVTERVEADAEQDRLLHSLTEGSRASLGNLQAAVELLAAPDVDLATRERFLAVVREEARAMAARLNDLAASSTQTLRTRWPLEDLHGAELLAAAQHRIAVLGGPAVQLREVDTKLWLRVDSFALLQALAHLARRLGEDYGIATLGLRLQAAAGGHAGSAGRAQLDLVWPSLPMSNETVMGWETEPLQGSAGMTLRDVVQRHDGEFWFERDRARQQQFFRFLLPLASEPLAPAAAAPAAAPVHAGIAEVQAVVQGLQGLDSRPEFYDFDLFAHSEASGALDEQPLASLCYTVFDTETTGLAPQQGDEIIQLGAVRVVNGRLLASECIDQLVDPRRSIPPAGIPIHGITPAMVAGQPPITEVLPAFHAFAADTVLVAHNAAFDMRFLQLKEATTGLRFQQPVLDTLLLSAVVHPQQESHRLEAIAERMGIQIVGRHTALGDALVTAEVFLKLLPLLAAMGITTLGQARAAAQQTYYARLKY